MTDTFQFKNHTLSLKLCNHHVSITVNEDTVGICDSIRTEAREYLLKLNQDSADADIAIGDICRFFEDCIDRLLYVGATDVIFGARPKKLFDLTDLLGYILSKIGEVIAMRTARDTEE